MNFQLQAVDISTEYGVAATFPTLGSFFTVVLNNVYYIAGILILFFLIFGGVTIIMGAGSGNSEKLEKGGKAVAMAVVGFAVVVFGWFIVKIVEVITGVDILNSGL
jgi:hypothetical protein